MICKLAKLYNCFRKVESSNPLQEKLIYRMYSLIILIRLFTCGAKKKKKKNSGKILNSFYKAQMISNTRKVIK